jgi:hypothetical protein
MLRDNGANPLIEQIQNVFYQDLVSLLIDTPGLDAQSLDYLITTQIHATIMAIVSTQYSHQDMIVLPTGTKVTEANCPNSYIGFFRGILALRRMYQMMSDEERKNVLDHLLSGYFEGEFASGIHVLATKVMQLDTFRAMIPGVKTFILEAAGLVDTAPVQRDDEVGVTADLIRESFYNEIVTQMFSAIEHQWIEKDEIEDQDAFLFLAMPALTLIESITLSSGYKGIRLLNDKVLTEQNCPQHDSFPELFVPILKIAPRIQELNDQQLVLLKMLCLAKPINIPGPILALKTTAITNLAAVINEVASQISRRGFFKQHIQQAIALCLESFRAAAPKPS